MEPVALTIWHKTDIGYKVIINNKHTGVLHFNDVYRELKTGDKERGYVKTIREEGKMDVALGEPGYARVEEATDKLLRLLNEYNGYLPFNDKSDPEEIHEFFGMSKKTFKMTTGNLYKQRKISFEKDGIKLIDS